MGRYTGFDPTADAATVSHSAPVVADFKTDPAVTGDAVNGNLRTADADADARKTLLYAAGAIGAGVLLLWFFGGIVLKDANL